MPHLNLPPPPKFDFTPRLEYTRRSMHFSPLQLGLACILLSFSLPAGAEIITIPAAADTALFEMNPDDNFGAQQDLPSGTLGVLAGETRSRLLVRFDLAAHLPQNAIIQSATVHLAVTKQPGGGGEESFFALHRVLRPWIEGTGSGGGPGGAPAEEGETTWNDAASPDTAWTEPGGLSGVDFVSSPVTIERVHQVGPYQFEFGSAQVTDFAEWLAQPELNHGYILVSQSEDVGTTARRFAAREHPDEELRPRLVLEYTLAPDLPPPTITGISIPPDGFPRIAFEAKADLRYRLVHATTLPAGPWLPASDFTTAPADGELTLQDTNPDQAQRFYQVEVQP